MGIREHLIVLVEKPRIGHEPIVQIEHGETDWLYVGKRGGKDCKFFPFVLQ